MKDITTAIYKELDSTALKFGKLMGLTPASCSLDPNPAFGGVSPIWQNIKVVSNYWNRAYKVLETGHSKTHLEKACAIINRGIDDSLDKQKVTVKDVQERVKLFRAHHIRYKFLRQLHKITVQHDAIVAVEVIKLQKNRNN